MSDLKAALNRYVELLRKVKTQSEFIDNNFGVDIIHPNVDSVHVYKGIENIPGDRTIDIVSGDYPIETSININGITWFQLDMEGVTK